MFKRTIYTILFFVYCFFMLWLAAKPAHAQSAFKSVHLFETPTTQATAGGTTTLLLASQTVQRFTGTQNQTVVLPNATTLTVGMYFLIANDSTGVLTVNDASSGLIATVLASNSVSLRLITNGSAAGVWSVENNYTAVPASGISGIVPLANGGTALANVASQGGIGYGTATGISLTAAQTSGQAIISQGTAAPIGFNPTSGAVLFAGTSGAMSQSANTFSWDQNNTRLTVGGGSNSIVVNGATKNSVISTSGSRASNEYEIGVHKHSNTLNPGIYFLRTRGSEQAQTIVQNGDLLGVMDSLGFDGVDYEIGAQIDYVVDGTPGSNDMPGAILFKTTPDGSATPATAATISNDKTLTVYGTLNAAGAVNISGSIDTALTTSGPVLTNSSGVISSEAQLALSRGGTNTSVVAAQGGAAYGTATGISLTAAGVSGTYLKSNGTGIPTFQAIQAATDISGILPLANGGTSANITASHGGLAYSTASAISIGPVASAGRVFIGGGAAAYALTAVGVSGQVLKSEGSATPIWSNTLAFTEPAAWTPTTQGLGTLGSSSCFWWRVGKTMSGNCKIVNGTATGVEMRVNLPNSLTINSTEYPSIRNCGYWVLSTAGASANKAGPILCNGGNGYINFSVDSNPAAINPLVAQTADTVFGAGQTWSFYFETTITGWTAAQ